MGNLSNSEGYESLRKARIAQNKARMESLGLLQRAGELRALASPAASPPSSSPSVKRAYRSRVIDKTALRRSERLKKVNGAGTAKENSGGWPPQVAVEYKGVDVKIRKELFQDRCPRRFRGSVHDPVYGTCCHFCRQKKLCAEEDCRRCCYKEMDQPCIGKSECSICHSSNGVLCRACLKVRYGEELEEVRANKNWMCPHCIEEKGARPYWICNSSLCLKKRKIVPLGIAIYEARAQGYISVAHMLMDRLKHEAS